MKTKRKWKFVFPKWGEILDAQDDNKLYPMMIYSGAIGLIYMIVFWIVENFPFGIYMLGALFVIRLLIWCIFLLFGKKKIEWY